MQEEALATLVSRKYLSLKLIYSIHFCALAIQYARVMGLRVIAVDTGEEKKQLCLKLGAEKWIDFKLSKDIVKDIKDATDGLGAHSAVVTAASVGVLHFSDGPFFLN